MNIKASDSEVLRLGKLFSVSGEGAKAGEVSLEVEKAKQKTNPECCPKGGQAMNSITNCCSSGSQNVIVGIIKFK